MSDIALNTDWDIAFIDGDLSEVSGGQLTRQNSKFRLQIIAGELFEDTRAGVPWLSDMVDPRVSMDAKKAILRANIVKSFGCISVDSLSVVVEDDVARVDFAGTCSSGQFEESLVIYKESAEANSLPSFGTQARIINLPAIDDDYTTTFSMYGSEPVLCIVDSLDTGISCEIVTLGNLVIYTKDGQLLVSGNGAVTLPSMQVYDDLYIYVYQPFPKPQQTITLSFVITPATPDLLIINAMDNEPTNERKSLITDTYSALDAAGIWDKADVLCFRAAADLQAGLLDWKRLVDGSWIPGDGIFVTDSGFDTNWGNGGEGMRIGYNPLTDAVNYTQDSACIAALVSDYVAVSGSGYIFGASFLSTGSQLFFWASGSTVLGRINSADAGLAEDTSASPEGFWILQRTASNAVEIYKNGALFASSSQVSNGIPNDQLQQGESNGSTICARHKFLYAGAPLDSTERAALQTIVNDYLAGL